jgi:hypothetical protein
MLRATIFGGELGTETEELLFFNRFKNESAAAATVSTLWFRLHSREEHATTDRARFINFHFGLFYVARAVFKFDNHILIIPFGSVRWVG